MIIPGSVETIYRGAFAHCRSLKNVTLLDGIQNIEAAFGYCPIKSIAIPASVIKISNKAFGYSLENVTVDASNKVYDSRDNCNCIIETATNTIVQGSVNSKIPSGITELGDFLFEEIGITSMVVPEGVKKIGHRVFDNCSELQSVTLPSTLESLGYNVFQNCTSLTSIELPSGLTEMGEAVFIGCENLTSIKVPGGVEVIEKYTFGECTNLKSAIFEEGVKTTKGYSFNNCKNLESVEFPSSITSIGFDFIECPKLKKVVVKATTPPTIESSDFFTGMTIYVPAASVDTYKAADYWKFLTIKSVDDL